jgi:hypothetical protein
MSHLQEIILNHEKSYIAFYPLSIQQAPYDLVDGSWGDGGCGVAY